MYCINVCISLNEGPADGVKEHDKSENIFENDSLALLSPVLFRAYGQLCCFSPPLLQRDDPGNISAYFTV